jgi:hypothetical protein
MQEATAFSQLLRGQNIPGGSVQQTVGPDAGSYSNSPLSQIVGLMGGLGSLLKGVNSAPGVRGGGAIIMKKGGQAHRSKAHAYIARGGSLKMRG